MPTLIESKPTATQASSDGRVQRKIQQRVDSSYRFAFSRVTWSYEDGRLTLHGRVPSFYLKQLLQELMRDIEEVQQINNDVDVDSPTGKPR